MPLFLINARVKALREERSLNQAALAHLLGFKDRQTVSDIETGKRHVSAEELMRLTEVLKVSLDHFTDPFLLVGEGSFSWRQTDADIKQLNAYESEAKRWIAAFRELASRLDYGLSPLRRTLALSPRSTFEDAMWAGEWFADEFDLGEVPAERLVEVMEKDLGLLVLMVDMPKGVSGAACRLDRSDTVLISRNEFVGRRHFDLAHELFHLLTWDVMPPKHLEGAEEVAGNRIEQLANHFAGAVLMPERVLKRFGGWQELEQEEVVGRLNLVADRLQVTSSALRWRLAALRELKQTTARSLPDKALRNNGRRGVMEVPIPPLFSKPFAEVIAFAIDKGYVSVRRTAGLLDMTIEDLEDLFAAHGVENPISL